LRFLANENVARDAIVALRERGHDVVWIRTDSPGSNDRDVLDRSVAERRILLTFDKDFGELAFHAHLPAECGVILFRLNALSSALLSAAVVTAIESRADWAGHFAVVEEHRIRMRSL
jgi:predicted nuclease of predicted toxin-antitoxin system